MLPGILRRDGIELVHSLAYTSPIGAGCAAVVTIHDVNFRTIPMALQRRLALEVVVPWGARRADHVIAVSDFTRREITCCLGVPSERISVVHEAADEVDQAESVAAPDSSGYLLAFSSESTHKGMGCLLGAFARARSAGMKQRLTIVGRLPSDVSLGAAGRWQDYVEVTGYLARPDWEAAFQGAAMLVFPSQYEGFGLPVLEAMQRGVPVACSNRASLPEIAGDAAIYFDPDDVEDMAAAILRLTRDTELAVDLARRGRHRAASFDWCRSARETLAVYQLALNGTPAVRVSESAGVLIA
jgi:glycosyltransferase involved in cell wall biosynthesis